MRKVDTHWRSKDLAMRHPQWGFSVPLAGTQLPMVEYDRGVPVGVINYLPRRMPLPHGDSVMSAYRALGTLYGGDADPLPFFTVRYDDRNWAFQTIGHNGPAAKMLGHTGWVHLTELQFVDLLYRLRGRIVPPGFQAYGVDFSNEPWILTEPSADFAPSEPWPGALMSARRRNYEPVERVRGAWRNPCVDIDFAVVDRNDRLALVVDYKTASARVMVASTNLRALSSLRTKTGRTWLNIPTLVVRYQPSAEDWTFSVHCANKTARDHLAFILGHSGANPSALASTVVGDEWVGLSEDEWTNVLIAARDL